MSFPQYESYHDTGTQWLGWTPSHWRTVPFWSLFRRIKRTGFPEAELLSVYRDYGVVRKSDRDDNFNNPSEDLSAYQIVEPGDLAMNKMKAWQGSLGISPFLGIVSPAYFVFRPTHNQNSRYLHYLLRSPPFAAGFMAISKGIRPNQWDIDPDHLSQMPVLLPSIAEQAAIVALLDRETAKIDALVEEQRRLIELLKEKLQAVISHAVTKGLDPFTPMKDSGVEWLGEVPSHWSIRRLKLIAAVQSGVAKGKDIGGRDTKPIPYLRVANVQAGYLDLSDVAIIELPVEEVDRYLLRVGDVLMNEGGDYDKLGRGDVWRGQIEPCVHQNHVFAVRPFGVTSDWLNVVTGTAYARHFFMDRSKQSTNLASISSTNLMELPVPVPSEAEQGSILEQIGRMGTELANLSKAAETSVQLLIERRAALISATVTGKIDVRGLAAGHAGAEAA